MLGEYKSLRFESEHQKVVYSWYSIVDMFTFPASVGNVLLITLTKIIKKSVILIFFRYNTQKNRDRHQASPD